jgi:hypothetical protein
MGIIAWDGWYARLVARMGDDSNVWECEGAKGVDRGGVVLWGIIYLDGMAVVDDSDKPEVLNYAGPRTADDPKAPEPAGSLMGVAEGAENLPQVLQYSSLEVRGRWISLFDFDAITIGLSLVAVFWMGVVVPGLKDDLSTTASWNFVEKSQQFSALTACVAFCVAVFGLCATKGERPLFLVLGLLFSVIAFYCAMLLPII